VKQFFPNIKEIKYEGPKSKNPLAFKTYNAKEKIAGKSMKDHLRFAVAYWHTMKGSGADQFGAPTHTRPWNESSDPMKIAEATMRAAFEFTTKLGVDYYCFHDSDIAPDANDLREKNKRLDRIVKLAAKLQSDTNVKLLWNTSNMFSNPRFAHGASTNPDALVFAWAASQVKKMLEVGLELGATNYVFWGGREGYETLLNVDMKRDLDHLGAFLHMAVDYAREIGFNAQFLIEPKPKEPTKHQYDFDAATVIGFLKAYDLDPYFKLNIECNHATLAGHTFQHDLAVSAMNGMLGSVDANRGDTLLGWDTDEFPTDLYGATFAMLVILEQNGLAPGGLNFDAHVRRSSTDLEDLFIAHIGAMDAFAHGLKVAARIIKDGALSNFVKNRYASYDSGIGAKIEAGTTDFKELEAYVLAKGNSKQISGKQEMLENVLNQYILGA